MTIAIVDDIKEERVLLRTRLEKIFHQKDMGFHCCEYENGEAFLEASKDQDITVLFLDIYMDGANGIEIAKEFRKSNKDCLLTLQQHPRIMRWKVFRFVPCTIL